jgi:hypothetical protein
MMRILGSGLPVPLLRRAFRKEFREQGAPGPKSETPKAQSPNAESKSEAKTEGLKKMKGKRSKPKASDEPPRTWRVPYTVGGECNLPWFVTPL